jgi:GTP-binding protein
MTIISAQFIQGVTGTADILYDGVPQVAFIGRSNVGKSSIINALVNRTDLVKVGKKPGKTLQINFFSINHRECYFVDLPGYGYAKIGPKEKEKLAKLILWYIQYSEVRPRKIVLILDAKVGMTEFDTEMVKILREQGHSFIILANKTDKLNQKDLSAALGAIRAAAGDSEVVSYSAKEKKGTPELLAQLGV